MYCTRSVRVILVAWTVNFKACKRCSSGEYWLVSSRFTNTVHPVAAGSRTRAWICTHSCTSRSPWEGGEGFPKSRLHDKTRNQQTKMTSCLQGLPPVLWLPFQQRSFGAEVNSQPPRWAAALSALHSAPTSSIPSPRTHARGQGDAGWAGL